MFLASEPGHFYHLLCWHLVWGTTTSHLDGCKSLKAGLPLPSQCCAPFVTQQPEFSYKMQVNFCHFPTRNSPWLLIFIQSKDHGPHHGQRLCKIGPQSPLCPLLESLPLFQPHCLPGHSLTAGSTVSPCDLCTCHFFHLECMAQLFSCSRLSA